MDANAGVDLTRSCIDFVAVTEELCSQTTDVAAPVGSSVVTTAGAVQRFAYNQLRDAVRCIKESTCRLDPITPWEGELGDRLRWKHSLAKIREDCKQFGQSLESIYANAQEAFRSQLGWSELELDLSLREIELLHCEAMVYLKHAQQRLVKLEEGISCPTASPQDEFFWNVDLMDAVPLTIGETLRLQRGHTYLFIVEQPWTLLRVQV
ncbi:MAG: hypothetical protein KDK78_03670 [Chlamydiia bacterium]|nr:hypothetical protein [Chlamydiia bacterium]